MTKSPPLQTRPQKPMAQMRGIGVPPQTSSAQGAVERPGEGAANQFCEPRFQHDFGQMPAQAVRQTAEQGIKNNGTALPHVETLQSSFGRHSLADIQAHVGGPAAIAARSLGAKAYAFGNSVAFDRPPDLLTAAHEAAHVIQQRSGVDLPRGISSKMDRFEQHADAVAARVQQGRSAEDLLDQPAGGGSHRVVQCFAFVNETQLKKSDASFTPEMKAMVSDTTVRNYTGVDEFKKHADKQTDYLGNLAGGTWLRFNPTGTNLLGENHTQVTLQQSLAAVGSKSFIYEPFSSDTMKAGSNFHAAYDIETKDRFKRFGVESEPDKQQFGAESLLAKMGFNLTELTPYFEKEKTHPLSDLTSAEYFGQPAQRYLKIAWAWSKDKKADVEAKQKAGVFVPPKLATLATVHGKVEGQLDNFITSLKVDGFLGDELVKKGNDVLLAPLAEFAKAFTEAMIRVAADDPSSRMSMGESLSHTGFSTTSEKDKEKIFTDWRNFNFEDNVKAATKRGVRYAGMGRLHLDHLVKIGLDNDQHPFDMEGRDISAFKDLTNKLKNTVKKP